MARTSGGRPIICRSRSSTTSASTTPTPYHVYGGCRTNSSWVGDSAYPGGITSSRWENMFKLGDGFWMFSPIPADPDYVFCRIPGWQHRPRQHAYPRDTGHQPRLGAADLSAYTSCAFNWNTPLRCPRHEAGHGLHRRAVSGSARATTAVTEPRLDVPCLVGTHVDAADAATLVFGKHVVGSAGSANIQKPSPLNMFSHRELVMPPGYAESLPRSCCPARPP